MKLKIKVKVLTEGCFPVVMEKGDFIDLRAAKDIHLECPYALARSRKGGESTRRVVFPTTYIPLGVSMQLPSGMEGIMVSRSSSNKKYRIMQSNAVGIIDNTYCGDNDQWHMPVIATGEVDIKKGDRICQFRIQLSQKATLWQKLKWLFSNGIELVEVESLNNPDRNGLGSTGKE